MKNKTLAKCYIKFFVEFIHHASKQDIIITAALLPIFWRRQNTSAQKPCNVFYAIHGLHFKALSHILMKSTSFELQQNNINERIKAIWWK